MSVRLWYPQLDVYDSMRRMMTLLRSWKPESSGRERLYIADFYLANPPLLHQTHLPEEVRKSFLALKIVRPEKSFLSYPSPPILFQKMAEVQRSALQTMIGKSLLDLNALADGAIRTSSFGRQLIAENFDSLLSPAEKPLVTFLASEFATIGLSDIAELRRRTGLRRVAG